MAGDGGKAQVITVTMTEEEGKGLVITSNSTLISLNTRIPKAELIKPGPCVNKRARNMGGGHLLETDTHSAAQRHANSK